MKVLYILHYGLTPKNFYLNKATGKLEKKIGDGGSNIHINFIKYLRKKKNHIIISTFKDNYQFEAFFDKIPGIKIISHWTPQQFLYRYNFLIENIYKSIFLSLKVFFSSFDYDLLISATDFLPDVLSAFLLKLKNPQKKWVASYFLEALNPWKKNNPYRVNIKRFLQGFLYWFFQQFSYLLIRAKADVVLVTSEPDVKKFITGTRGENQIIVVRGGLDINPSERYLKKEKNLFVQQRKYDACFIGRFHAQKGVLELIKIWHFVCAKKVKAKLAMIGMGSLEEQIKKEILKFNLEENIDILGYKTGSEKYQIFKQSKIVIHPAVYDSGGMAACEAMAWKLPGVSFDLESLKTYYPKGMLKTPCFDLEKFADNVVKLLNDKKLYEKISIEALSWARQWDWNKKVDEIFSKILNGSEV